MIKISESVDEFFEKVFPNLKHKLRLAQLETSVKLYLLKTLVLSVLFTLNFTVISLLILSKLGLVLFILPLFLFYLIFFFFIFINLTSFYIERVRKEIENDIFVPARMFLTLLESGNSIISALVDVSYTKAKSSKYFSNIASEIYLGKNIEQAIDDAIKYTPSSSFRKVLEPVKKSLLTGTDIKKNLVLTLNDLSKEKIIEIEDYEKKLSPLSLFYMIFGTILPVIVIVGLIIGISLIGFRIEFFPFFFLILIAILIIQIIFISLYRSIRPLVKI